MAKDKITIRIDTDIIDQCKQMVPDGQDYQRLRNQALREWLIAQGVRELVRENLQVRMAKIMGMWQENSRHS